MRVISIVLLVVVVCLGAFAQQAETAPTQRNPVAVQAPDSTQAIPADPVLLDRRALVQRVNDLNVALAAAELNLKRTKEWQEYTELLSALRGISNILNDTTIVVRPNGVKQ